MRRLFVLIAIAAVVAYGGWYAYRFYWALGTGVPNSYAVMCAGELICQYMRTHENQWPASWDDLQPVYDKTYAASYGGDSFFEDMKVRVAVDWSARPHELLKQGQQAKSEGESVPFRAVWLVDGSTVHWHGAEPNQIIYEYLWRELPRVE